jgi:hypothetical protein
MDRPRRTFQFKMVAMRKHLAAAQFQWQNFRP